MKPYLRLIAIYLYLFIGTPEYVFAEHAHYSRSQWGIWQDADGDCQNTRAEILIQYSLVPVKFASDRKCRVISGIWICPYTGHIIYNASKIDIDHIVPLSFAYHHGGSRWSREKKRHFANDPENLLPVEDRINRSKGRKGLKQWLPPYEKFHREYRRRWERIRKKYGLQY